MVQIKVETEKRNQGVFLFGQFFDHFSINFIIHRDGIARYLVKGIVEEAIGKGFDITDPDSKEPVDWNSKFQELQEPHFNELVEIAKIGRSYGQSVGTTLETKDKNLMFRGYEPVDYELKFTNEGILERIKAWFRINTASIPLNTHIWEGDELVDTFYYVYDPKTIVGEAMSYLEPIWDALWALYVIHQNSTLYAVRVGGGLKVAKVPMGLLKNQEWRSEFNAGLINVNSPNTIMIIPKMEGNVENNVEFELVTGDGSIDFKAIRDLHLEMITAYSGVPKNKLIGAELGMANSQENTLNFFDVLQGIQKELTPLIKWYVKQIAVFHDLIPEDDKFNFNITFGAREELTDEAKAELLAKKLANAQSLMNMASFLGITNKQINEMADLGFDITEISIEEREAERAETFNNDGVDEDDNNENDKEIEEEQEND